MTTVSFRFDGFADDPPVPRERDRLADDPPVPHERDEIKIDHAGEDDVDVVYPEELSGSQDGDGMHESKDKVVENHGRIPNQGDFVEVVLADIMRRLERVEQLILRDTASTHEYIDTADEVLEGVAISEFGVRTLTTGADGLFAQDTVYDFSHTVWDAPIFCGLGLLSYVDVCCMVVLTLANVAVQGCFIGLVALAMLDNDFSDKDMVTIMNDWRVLYAHNPDFADAFTDEPLATNICQGSFLRMHGTSQAILYKDMDHYTQPFLAMPRGGVMCMLSMFLWTLTCAKECKNISKQFAGIWAPNEVSMSCTWGTPFSSSFVAIKDKPKTWLYGEMRQKNYQIFIAPRRALAMTILVGLPRATILAFLTYVGCRFLIQTVQLSELILNSVALEVIMNADELIFSSFATPALIRMIDKAMPLRIPRSRKWYGACPGLQFALVATSLVTFGTAYLAPMIKTMRDAKSAMCGGDQNFLAAQVSYGPVVTLSSSKVDINEMRQSYKYRAIFQRTRHESGLQNYAQYVQYVLQPKYYASQNQVKHLKVWRDFTIQELAELP